MNKTKIPWCDYTINPVRGLCPMACEYCYARRMYRRFKRDPEISFIGPVALGAMLNELPHKPARIFVGSTIELFGDWVKPEWMEQILLAARLWGEKYGHTFIFLTKQPQNLMRWSPFPDSCWVGVSAEDHYMFAAAYYHLKDIEARVKFISIEPLLNWDHRAGVTSSMVNRAKQVGVNWLILGSRTQPVRHPPREWVDEIIGAADGAAIPVFVKEPMAGHYGIQRREWPVKKASAKNGGR